MPFESIVGHAAAIERLRSLVSRGRVAHAYLFAGPSGVGKRLVAREFARSLSADLLVVAKPEDKHEIPIEQVREISRQLSLKSLRPRVVIVEDAELLNEAGMNAFLKTLEEPPAGTTLILVTSLPSLLLPTIVSRCQTVLFFALKEDQVLAILKRDDADARLAASLADGSAGRAMELLEDLKEWGPESAELLDKVFKGDLNSVVEALTRIRDTAKARARATRILQIVALALRDALRGRRTSALDADDLSDRLLLVLDHISMIERNANVPLVVENALLRIG